MIVSPLCIFRWSKFFFCFSRFVFVYHHFVALCMCCVGVYFFRSSIPFNFSESLIFIAFPRLIHSFISNMCTLLLFFIFRISLSFCVLFTICPTVFTQFSHRISPFHRKMFSNMVCIFCFYAGILFCVYIVCMPFFCRQPN